MIGPECFMGENVRNFPQMVEQFPAGDVGKQKIDSSTVNVRPQQLDQKRVPYLLQ